MKNVSFVVMLSVSLVSAVSAYGGVPHEVDEFRALAGVMEQMSPLPDEELRKVQGMGGVCLSCPVGETLLNDQAAIVYHTFVNIPNGQNLLEHCVITPSGNVNYFSRIVGPNQ